MLFVKNYRLVSRSRDGLIQRRLPQRQAGYFRYENHPWFSPFRPAHRLCTFVPDACVPVSGNDSMPCSNARIRAIEKNIPNTRPPGGDGEANGARKARESY